MCKFHFFIKALTPLLLIMSGNIQAGQTVNYTGTVYATPVKALMPLGNGDGVMIMQSSGIVAVSSTPPSIHTMTCSGMGIVKPDESAITDFYCNLKENDNDSFDIKGTAGAGAGAHGEFDVIGGSGKWAGATGKGKFVRVIESEEGNKIVFEVEITAP